MGVSSTEVSLRAIREDLDLPAAGSVDERAVLNKANKSYLPVSLSEYKGNILGTQLYVPNPNLGGQQDWPKKRDEAYGTYYSFRSGSADAWGNAVRLTLIDISGNTGDYGVETRIPGMVLEDGFHRLTGSVTADFATSPGNAVHSQCHVQLLANASDYLSGDQSILANRVYYKSMGTQFNVDQPVNLSSSKPYITLIFRNLNTGMGATNNAHTHEFSNFKLVKI